MELEKRIQLCKSNKYEMNNLISEYKPFIAKIVQEQTGRYVEYGKDDELSVGLIAFEEAIRAYQSEKGNFFTFASGVIKRRIIDYYRKEYKHDNVVPMSAFYDEKEEAQVDVTAQKSVEMTNIDEESQNRKQEILQIQKELKKWDISFLDLPKHSPKHENTKKLYKQIIDTIINNENLLFILKSRKYLPVAEIQELTGISRKTIERSRKYVIAMVIILTGEFKYVQGFIDWR